MTRELDYTLRLSIISYKLISDNQILLVHCMGNNPLANNTENFKKYIKFTL